MKRTLQRKVFLFLDASREKFICEETNTQTESFQQRTKPGVEFGAFQSNCSVEFFGEENAGYVINCNCFALESYFGE